MFTLFSLFLFERTYLSLAVDSVDGRWLFVSDGSAH